MSFKIKFNANDNTITMNEVPVSLHCHHYNCGMLKAIEEISAVDGHEVYVETAAEEFFKNFKKYFSVKLKGSSPEDALKEAAELYRLLGFGRIDLSGLTENGGTAEADSSYFAVGWLAKYGRRPTPVCYLTCGFISGILAAIFDTDPKNYQVTEKNCLILGSDYCEFKISRKSDVD